MITPISVSVFGCTRHATQTRMIARSGNMQIAPMMPVKVGRDLWGKIEGSDTRWGLDIVTHAHLRAQGTDRPFARAAGSVSVFQCGRRHDLCGEGPIAARPRPYLSC